MVIFTSENLLNLLICLFDFFNEYNSLRLKYYYLNLGELNIKLSVNIRALKYINFFGVSHFRFLLFNSKYFVRYSL